MHRCKCGGEFLAWTVLFIHIICCSGDGSIKQESPDTYPSQVSGGSSKQGSPDTDPSKTASGSSSKQESSDTDTSQTPGKNQVKNRLGQSLLIVFIDSQTHYFFYYYFTFLL